jgi:hypothetical protein
LFELARRLRVRHTGCTPKKKQGPLWKSLAGLWRVLATLASAISDAQQRFQIVDCLGLSFSALSFHLPVFSSQFFVLISLGASGDCSLFGTRGAHGGADIRAWLASSPGFSEPILSLLRYDYVRP